MKVLIVYAHPEPKSFNKALLRHSVQVLQERGHHVQVSDLYAMQFNPVASEADFTDTERTPKNLREVEAESVALLCCEALNLEGAEYCRGYIQNWLCPAIGYNGDAIPEKSAQKIFRAADQILRAGRLQASENEQEQ